VLGIFAISWAAVLARLALVSGYVAAWWRLLVGSIVLLCYVTVFKRSLRLDWYTVIAGVALAIHFSLWLESLNYMAIAPASGIVISYPVVTLPFEYVVLREKFSRLQMLGVVVTLLGIYVLSQPWSGATSMGVILAFAATVAGSIYFQIGRVVGKSSRDTMGYVVSVYLVAFLVTSVICCVLGVNPLATRAESIVYLVLMGLVPMAIGHTALNYAMRRYPATLVTTAMAFEPYGATTLGWLILNEKPSLGAIVGIALTVLGVVLTFRGGRSSRSRK